jgi:predicted transglutaminase-like cysteine proteinase
MGGWLNAALLCGAMLGATETALARGGGNDYIPTRQAIAAPTGFQEFCRRGEALCRTPAQEVGAVVPVSAAAQQEAAFWRDATTPSCAEDATPRMTSAVLFRADGPAPGGCAPSEAAPVPVLARKRQVQLLQQVNVRVNTRVRQADDQELYGRAEVWQRSGSDALAAGDCEDIAIEKRYQLLAAGFPADRLFFAVVYGRQVGLHTVLVARVEGEDLVLDNLSASLLAWRRTGYGWVSVQSTADPLVWHAVDH